MKTIRIGTRTSPLAMWQANAVKDALLSKGYRALCIGIESSGDLDLKTPLYAMGIAGVFTKELDTALLNDKIDIAVHSLKDVPTLLASGLSLSAVLPRGSFEDVIVTKYAVDFIEKGLTIASSSIRRKSQWLERFPTHQIVPVRGNIQTRLNKLNDQKELSGMIFAKAGLERLGLLNENTTTLDWMLPAPAQGIIGVICRSNDTTIQDICQKINHYQTFVAALIEREFMYTLQGGCSVPVSCLTRFEDNNILIEGAIHSIDGTKSYRSKKRLTNDQIIGAGASFANDMLAIPGATLLMEEIRKK
ncbi:hydroxymethylbilane synthase [Sediminibacterium sp. C3]|uniref:hydroxymethylbilane synthase n=1 Tax=Sediminibacterium sp. C3 TaxID=1267211 RepID=UPI00042A2541|nr:hydroxymethylbilane synthase [Sediminibacterium sp. C3]